MVLIMSKETARQKKKVFLRDRAGRKKGIDKSGSIVIGFQIIRKYRVKTGVFFRIEPSTAQDGKRGAGNG